MTITYTTAKGNKYQLDRDIDDCFYVKDGLLYKEDLEVIARSLFRRYLPIASKTFIQRMFTSPIKEVKRSTYIKEVSTFSNGDSMEAIRHKTIYF